MTGMPMLTAIRAIIRPRRLRSSMKRVVTMPHVGIHEPRWSRARLLGPGWEPDTGADASSWWSSSF